MNPTSEYILEVSGSPALEQAIRDLAREWGDSFKIDSVEEIDDPARLGFKLSKAVAIVAIISGVLTSADLCVKFAEAIEQSGSEVTTFQSPQSKIEVQLPKGKKLTPQQQKELLAFIQTLMK